MKAIGFIDNILDDLEYFEPESLSDIVRLVRGHDDFASLSLLVKNTKSASEYLLDQCICLVEEDCLESDIQLAGMIVIIDEANTDIYKDLIALL